MYLARVTAFIRQDTGIRRETVEFRNKKPRVGDGQQLNLITFLYPSFHPHILIMRDVRCMFVSRGRRNISALPSRIGSKLRLKLSLLKILLSDSSECKMTFGTRRRSLVCLKSKAKNVNRLANGA